MLILEANDTIAPVQPKPGTQVLIPSSDAAARRAEGGHCRQPSPNCGLYYFPPGENQVQVYPPGIGQVRSETPEMTHPRGAEDP